jgi:hypothetical protein
LAIAFGAKLAFFATFTILAFLAAGFFDAGI